MCKKILKSFDKFNEHFYQKGLLKACQLFNLATEQCDQMKIAKCL